MKKQVGVIFGGNSVEHEISIITSLQAIESLDRNKYEPIPIYITKNGKWFTSDDFFSTDNFKDLKVIEKKYDEIVIQKEDNTYYIISKNNKMFKKGIKKQVDFIIEGVHGTNVEDGTLAGYLETVGIPYVGPTVLSGAIGQDKAVMKDILKANNIPQTKYVWFYKSDDMNEMISNCEKELSYPMIIKPSNLGSSIAITIANNKEELENSIDLAFQYDRKVVIEECIQDFLEVNISVLGNYKEARVSTTELVNKAEDFLSYEDKYISGNKKGKTEQSGMASLTRVMPAPIESSKIEKINQVAIDAFRVLNANGVVRIDMIIKDDEVYLNEVNNIPGSLSFYLWEETGLTYTQLLDTLIDLGVNNYFEKQKTTFSIDSNVLNMMGKKGSK